MLSEMAMIRGDGEGFNGEEAGRELGLLLREQRRQESSDRERKLNIYRSGSAPPTVEGSLTAISGLFDGDIVGGDGLTEEELRSDPDYVSYYYSNVNLNPRLPPPVLSKEDWRFARRAGSSGLGGVGDRRKLDRIEEGGDRSLFSMQPGFCSTEVDEEEPRSSEWLDEGGDGLIGLPGLSLGRQKSFAGLFQDDQSQRASVSGRFSCPSSRNAFDDCLDPLRSGESRVTLRNNAYALDGLRSSNIVQSAFGAQNNVASVSPTFASVVRSSISRNNTPDPQLAARVPSPRLPPVGVKLGNNDKKNSHASNSLNRASSALVDSDDLISALSGMNMSNAAAIDEKKHSSLQKETVDRKNILYDLQDVQNLVNPHTFLQNPEPGQLNGSSVQPLAKSSVSSLSRNSSSLGNYNNAILRADQQVEFQRASLHSNNSYTNYGLNGYSVDALTSMMSNHVGVSNLPPLFESASVEHSLGGFSSGSNFSGSLESQNLYNIGNQATASTLQMPFLDSLYIQYLSAAQAATSFNIPSVERAFMGNSYADLLGIQKAYIGALLQPQKQFGLPFHGKSGYYSSPGFGLGMMYPGSPVASPGLPGSPIGPGSPLRHGEHNLQLPMSMWNLPGNVIGSWHLDSGGNFHDAFSSSLIEEFKNNKTKCYELSDIAGHVVEFSADQYGSRFIQQKLETSTSEEKGVVFDEIMPHAFSLMTDVFGNYVVQKFFEHGSPSQRRDLANQLTGHVLGLSLQMYGCRVIQKAIEVVDLDQQTIMVEELDGNVMRCVRDQNGNHVIQKCIECIPQDAIEFIISAFYDQVVTLSTHPYGCRVIQRVLEHCHDPKTQQIMMDEILQSVCMLTQDQYGNYVVQHILEHGKPHERSAIIEKLAGQIVQMSQQKFASNVVEKCLTFGDPEERQLLVNEMLGTTDENEPLQAMMKDQFANYVVQKVLETCDDQQRELILSRIKVHLNALKKYTYGKHIVARVEKLVAAGERRIRIQPSYTT